jgi:uncharacterized protein YrrD
MIGSKLECTDGEIGKVIEFYFDDDTWIVRYLIVKTGSWLSEQKVLISTNVLIKNSDKADSFPVNLTMEQIRNSPDIDTERPVSRQQEIELSKYYNELSYAGNGFFAGGSIWGIDNPSVIMDQKIVKENESDKRPDDDLHLRSSYQVTGYHIHATDGEIGHVKDFIIDDENWKILYLVVDTHNWIGGKKVLIPVANIKEVQWDNSKVFVNETVDAIKNSLVFDESY